MFRSTVSLLVVLGSLVACSPPAPSTDAVRASMAKAWDGFNTSWVAGNASGVTAAFFTEDAINTVPGTAEMRGRDAITTEFAGFLKDNKVVNLDHKTEEVDVAGDLAVERGTFVQTVQPREGAAQEQHGRYIAIWKRGADGSWKCRRFLFNYAEQ
jgi:uncharacterized protein (TIGR02246 family)